MKLKTLSDSSRNFSKRKLLNRFLAIVNTADNAVLDYMDRELKPIERSANDGHHKHRQSARIIHHAAAFAALLAALSFGLWRDAIYDRFELKANCVGCYDDVKWYHHQPYQRAVR